MNPMKAILLLLLTCLPLWAATTYPMLSTTASRTVTGGATNLATLNTANNFTGANTLTNTGNVFGGDGDKLTGLSQIRQRILLRTNSLYFATNTTQATEATFTETNYSYNGGLTFSQTVFDVTLPALMSSNSIVGIKYIGERTNSISANSFLDFELGTNLCASTSQITSTSLPRTYGGYTTPFGVEIFRNHNSFTQQLVFAPSAALTAVQTQFYIPAAYVDTTTTWRLRAGLLQNVNAIQATNTFIREIVIVEQWEVP